MRCDMEHSLPLNNAAGTLKGLARSLRVMGGTSGVLYVISLTAAAGESLTAPACVCKACLSHLFVSGCRLPIQHYA